MVQHWKCCVRKRTAGSNPVLSANKKGWVFAHLFLLLGDVDLNLFRFAIRVLCTRHSCREFSPARNGNILSSPPIKKGEFLLVFFCCLGGVDLNLFRFAIRVLAPVILAESSRPRETAISCPLRQQKKASFYSSFFVAWGCRFEPV